MYRILITLLLVFCFFNYMDAQETDKNKKVDANTYKLYLDKQWDNLVDVGEEALKEGVDFYYLRMRLGMAYYYSGNYRKAEKHFRKAIDIGYKNDIVDEYIYYCFLFSGKGDDADLWGRDMTVAMQKKLGIDKHPFFNTFGISNTYSFNPDSYDSPMDNLSSLDGWRSITQSYNLFSINAGHRLGKGVKLNYQYARLDKENFYYYNDESADILDKSRKVQQDQFYMSLSVRLMQGFEVFGGFHSLNIKSKNKSFTLQQSNQGNGNGNSNIIIPASETSNSERLLFLGIAKEIGNINTSIAAYFSDFNNKNQSQFDLSFNYYPLGNLNFYTTSIISLFNDSGDIDDRSGVVFNQKFGFKISKYLWAEAFTGWGDMNNFVVNRGTGIYNGTEIVKNYSGANIIIPFVKSGVKIFINYSYYKNESLFTDINRQKTENPVNFNTHSITGGVQWNF